MPRQARTHKGERMLGQKRSVKVTRGWRFTLALLKHQIIYTGIDQYSALKSVNVTLTVFYGISNVQVFCDFTGIYPKLILSTFKIPLFLS